MVDGARTLRGMDPMIGALLLLVFLAVFLGIRRARRPRVRPGPLLLASALHATYRTTVGLPAMPFSETPFREREGWQAVAAHALRVLPVLLLMFLCGCASRLAVHEDPIVSSQQAEQQAALDFKAKVKGDMDAINKREATKDARLRSLRDYEAGVRATMPLVKACSKSLAAAVAAVLDDGSATP